MIRVLIVSGQTSLQRPLGAILEPEMTISVQADRKSALDLISRDQADVVIVDLDTRFAPLVQQLAFLSELRGAGVPVLVLTDDDRRSTALELLEHGVYDQIRKPPSPLEMSVVIRRAHEHALLKRELAEAKRKLLDTGSCDRLAGNSFKMMEVYELIRRVANLPAAILIHGESGTGKELVARAIHNLGNRAALPFVAVSCGAIPETLIESELFGHEKGAFTGAHGARVGLLEAAGAGTLFLDEIGELSPATQVKLLRVLQEKEFTSLGGRRKIPLQARVLFATHRNLKEMVEAGTFRSDLFYRITVMKIEVPPLRLRLEDVGVLANLFLRRYASSCGKSISGIDARAMRALTAYSWPGNVRELENTIHRAVIISDSDTIGIADLPDIAPQLVPAAPVSIAFEDVLREFKRGLAERTLMECEGNKTRAALTLQISRAYFHRLLRDDHELPRISEA
ncbi:MAG TPA: sigma-54 dependent transcriptional regulator [Bryobacteraceae bacterium]|nr:sigma-54 dependent transcriptional regulator [Bryobacteraceae bacterium]